MSPDFKLGLQLLVVGMISVFLILGIVVALGRVLIYFVSKYAAVPVPSKVTTKSVLDKERIAVMSSVVEVVTQGQGILKSVTKL